MLLPEHLWQEGAQPSCGQRLKILCKKSRNANDYVSEGPGAVPPSSLDNVLLKQISKEINEQSHFNTLQNDRICNSDCRRSLRQCHGCGLRRCNVQRQAKYEQMRGMQAEMCRKQCAQDKKEKVNFQMRSVQGQVQC